ncbi:hypothetical protein T07_3838 [Trichinella nelsoni]|uniref:Uncharacterized protein n=1 Tax=Trichinella nelsoni TaxID=6336 RepID=A0A0V0SIA3_9BILA|nr:hypothetical protein T07_3838 [Trichinella nelsoni]
MQWISARPVDASLSLDQNLASQSDIRGGPSMDESSIAEARCPFNEDEISFTPVFTAPVSPFPTPPAPPAHFRPAEPEAVQHEPKSPLILANWFRVRRLTRDKCGKPKWRRLPTVPPRWYSRNSTKESSIASIFKPFHTVALDIIGETSRDNLTKLHFAKKNNQPSRNCLKSTWSDRLMFDDHAAYSFAFESIHFAQIICEDVRRLPRGRLISGFSIVQKRNDSGSDRVVQELEHTIVILSWQWSASKWTIDIEPNKIEKPQATIGLAKPKEQRTSTKRALG